MFSELYETINDRITFEELMEGTGRTWEQIALALYQMLDDISTVDDIVKENAEAYRTLVQGIQSKKNEYLYSPDGYDILKVDENLVDHAKRELVLAGMFDKEVDGSKPLGDYNCMVAEAVLELMDVLASQRHSGFSAGMTRELFNRLSNFEALTEITDNPDEWIDRTEMSGGNSMWQSDRNPSLFSSDGGSTYWDLDDPIFEEEEMDKKEKWDKKKMHTSKVCK